MVIRCDRCPVRLDLGPAAMVAMHLRMPSGWIQSEPERHLCPMCGRRALDEAIAARAEQPEEGQA